MEDNLTLYQKIESTTDNCEELFYFIVDKRDKSSGEEKSKLRKLSKLVDKAFFLLEEAELLAEKIEGVTSDTRTESSVGSSS